MTQALGLMLGGGEGATPPTRAVVALPEVGAGSPAALAPVAAARAQPSSTLPERWGERGGRIRQRIAIASARDAESARGEHMSDFAPWLRNQSSEDGELVRLQEFIDAHSRDWPYFSNKLSDFMRVIIVSRDKNEMQLLDALERYYIRWRNSIRTYVSGGFWSNFGPLALFLLGMIAILFLMYRIYAPSLLVSLADPAGTQGPVIFLFAFAATSVIIAGAIGLIWLGKPETTSGFGKVKDVATVLIGVLGTVAVFYFVSVFAADPIRSSADASALAQRAALPSNGANGSAAGGGGATASPGVSPAPAPQAPSGLTKTTTSSASGASASEHTLPAYAGAAAPPLAPVPMAAIPNRQRGRP